MWEGRIWLHVVVDMAGIRWGGACGSITIQGATREGEIPLGRRNDGDR